MNSWHHRTATAGRFLALAALGLAACTDADSGSVLGIEPSFTSEEPLFGHTKLAICKYGSDATFHVQVSGVPDFTVNVPNGECVIAWSYDPVLGGQLGTGQQVVATEQVLAPNVVLDSIVKDSVFAVPGSNPPEFDMVRFPAIIGTNSVGGIVAGSKGLVVHFYNHIEEPPPPGGGEGCTPGYWKQAHHFDSWPAAYTPSTLFSSVFEDAFPGKTLVQVLATGGGGLKALGRHTVAALLNGGSDGVTFDLNAQQVVAAFNAVFPGGDYEGQKNIFANFNEQGCPLN